MIRIIWRAVPAWLALSVVLAVGGALVVPRVPVGEPGSLPLTLVSNALVTLVAAVLAARAISRGWSRVLTLLALVWGIDAVNLVEGAFFSIAIPRVLTGLFAVSFLAVLALALVLDRVSGPAAPGPAAWPAGRGAGSWVGRIVLADLLYVVFYLTAGMIVFPFVRHFYEGKPIPGFEVLVPLQVARGLAFVGLLLLMASRLALPRAVLAPLAGLTLSVLGGIAPLLVPNPFMPGSVRLPHMIEVGLSNFLFGWLATLILTAPRKDKAAGGVPSAVSAGS